MRKIFATVVPVFFALSANASLLTTEGTGGSVEKVQLPTMARLATPEISLKSVGAGLRDKKVVLVNVKVYVGQLFVSNLETFKKTDTDALNSLSDQKAAAIQLHFLRDVDSENVRNSFRDALKNNSVNLEDTSVKAFLNAVVAGGEAQKGKVMTVLAFKNDDGTETVVYENTAGKATEVKGPAGLMKNIFAIWLGKPSDDGVKKLKSSILK